MGVSVNPLNTLVGMTGEGGRLLREGGLNPPQTPHKYSPAGDCWQQQHHEPATADDGGTVAR